MNIRSLVAYVAFAACAAQLSVVAVAAEPIEFDSAVGSAAYSGTLPDDQLMKDENGRLYRVAACDGSLAYAECPSGLASFTVASGTTLTIFKGMTINVASISGAGDVMVGDSTFLFVLSASGFTGHLTVGVNASAVLPSSIKDRVTIRNGGRVGFHSGAATANQTLVFQVQGAPAATLEEYPVLVRLSKESISGFVPESAFCAGTPCVSAMAEGSDVEYPCEIEKWDTAGESIVWVRLPAVSNGTKFRLLLGRPSVFTASETWRRPTAGTADGIGDFIGVWHMNESAGTVADATGRGLTAEPYSDPKTPGDVNSIAAEGPVGNSRRISTEYKSNGPRLRVANGPALKHGSRFTVSCWAKENSIQQYTRLISRKTGYNKSGWEVQDDKNAQDGTFRQYAGGTARTTAEVANKLLWHRYVFVYDHTTLSAYVDGTLSKSATIAEGSVATDQDLALAIGAGADTEWTLGGWMDEVRLLQGAATADWVKADYDSQKADATFLAVDSVSGASGDAIGAVTVTTGKNLVSVKADVCCPAGAVRTVKAEMLDEKGVIVATKTTTVSVAGWSSPVFEFTDLAEQPLYHVRLTTNDGDTVKGEIQTVFVMNEILWKGPTSGVGEWSDPQNWFGGKVPGADDCAVFGEDVGTLAVTNTATTQVALPIRNVKVKAGTVTFVRAANTSIAFSPDTNLFTIATGAKVIWEYGHDPAADDTVSIHVAGGGTWQGPKYGGPYFGSWNGSRYLREVRAMEGSTVYFPGYHSYIRRYVAEKDATLTIGAISSLHGNEFFIVERGGLVKISNDSNNNPVGAILGEGTVRFTSNGKNYEDMNIDGPNTFSGVIEQSGGEFRLSSTVDEEKNRFVIGASNTMAAVSTLKPQETRLDFPVDIGSFYFGKIAGIPSNPIVTEDQSGKPIKLYTKGIDAGTYLTGSGSWYNTAAATVTGDQVRVTGKIDSTARVTFTNDASIVGNETRLGGYFTVAPNSTVTFSGAKTDVYRLKSTGLNTHQDTIWTIPLKNGVCPTFAAGSTAVIENGAVLRLNTGSGGNPEMASFILRNGGTLYLMRRDGGWMSSGTEDAYTADVDGGVFELSSYSCTYYATLVSTAAEDAPNWTCRVGAGGMVFRVRGVKALLYDTGKLYPITWPVRSVSSVNDGIDGGITLDGMGQLNVSREQALTGPINLLDGSLSVGDVAVTESSGVPLGTGDLVFDGGELRSETAFGGVRKFASGDGSKVRLSGAGHFVMTNDVEFGALERTRGGVLYVDTKTLDGEAASIKVTAGVETDANGRTIAPIIHTVDMRTLDFTKYDEDKGLLPFAESDYADGLGAGADSVARVKEEVTSSENRTVPENTVRSVLALKVEKSTKDADYTGITIKSGATLKVGDGTNPGKVLLSSHGNNAGRVLKAITGAGTLDFGTSEGVFVMPRRAGVYQPISRIESRISGQNGVSFVGVPSFQNTSSGNLLTLTGANDFIGGAVVENTMVGAASVTALGRDKVTVKGGFWHGATVNFTLANTTYANDFKIRGDGFFFYNRTTEEKTGFWDVAAGALRFGAGGIKLTGKIEIDGYSRITSIYNYPADPSEISGVISGGKLQFAKSKDIPIVLSAENTYTGGTEIVASKIVLRNGTLGTGPVLTDASTLRFENTAATAFANDLSGNGDLELAGTGEVSFTGDTSDYAPTAVDLCGGKRTFSSFPAFMTKFVNSGATRATIVLPPNLGRVKWNGAMIDAATAARLDFDIGLGTLLDLDGASLTFHRGLNGSVERMVNGTVNELKPEGGLILIVR